MNDTHTQNNPKTAQKNVCVTLKNVDKTREKFDVARKLTCCNDVRVNCRSLCRHEASIQIDIASTMHIQMAFKAWQAAWN